MNYQSINFEQKLSLFTEQWKPKVVAEMNDYQFKVVKLQGDFIWHDHKDTDEAFIVLEGELRIDFRDGAVTIGPGEMYVVPKGVEHKPFAAREGLTGRGTKPPPQFGQTLPSTFSTQLAQNVHS